MPSSIVCCRALQAEQGFSIMTFLLTLMSTFSGLQKPHACTAGIILGFREQV